jgi:hypothetical protein
MARDRALKPWQIVVGASSLLLLLGVYSYEVADSSDSKSQPIAGAAESGRSDLERIASSLLDTIALQESKQDATCWTTVRMIESFSIGQKLSPAAEIARIEGSRVLLDHLWRRASERSSHRPLDDGDVTRALPKEVADEPPGSGVVDGSAIAVNKLELKDHQRTTENWRTLLSIVIDALARPENGTGLAPFDSTGAQALAKATTTMTGLLLRQSGEVARKLNHDKVEFEDVRQAYQAVVDRLFPHQEVSADASAPTVLVEAAALGPKEFASIRSVSERVVLGKLRALRRYNQLGDAETYDDTELLAKYLSEVIQFPVTEDGAAALRKELIGFADLFLSQAGPFRSDTFANSFAGLAAEKRDPKAKQASYLLRAADVFNAAQNLFPTHKLANGDSEVYIVRNVMPDADAQSRIEERRAQLFAPSLDAIRDTGIHWLTLEQALKNRPNVAMDPFAAELMTEDLSEYAFFVLREAMELARQKGKKAVSAQAIQYLEWKYPMARFFPDPSQADAGRDGVDPKLRDALRAKHPGSLFRERPTNAKWTEACTRGRGGFQGFMGSGFAVGDIDGDGRPDLFLAADGCNRLLKNEGHFRFTDVTARYGLTGLDASSRHPIFADVDGDGLLDLFVTQSDKPSRLFLQKKGGHFTDVTDAYGLVTGKGAHSAHFFDYDHDGDLDLYIGAYGPSIEDTAIPTLDGRNGYPHQLFRNEDGARFVDVTRAAGAGSTAWTLASAAVDIDNDGWLDYWLANDWGRDEVFRNKGDGTFEEVGGKLRVDDRGSGMNVSVLDIDHDGRPDVFVSVIDMFSKTLRFVLPHESVSFNVDNRIVQSSYYMSGNKLFVARDQGFIDQTNTRIDARDKGWAWGTAFFDYENDGDDDMYVTNGWIAKSAFFEQRNQLLINEDDKLVAWSPAINEKVDDEARFPESYFGSSRAVAAVDLDGKGKSDLVVLDYERGLRIFENTAPETGHFVRVRLNGAGRNKMGIGAAVRVFAPGIQPVFRQVSAGSDYLTETALPLLFGIGESDHADRVVVRWASGRESNITGPFPTGATVVVEEGK